MTKCSNCKETNKYWFIVIGDSTICNDCNDDLEKKIVHFSTPQLFLRWVCKIHKCGSYNFNNLIRHEMDNCDIENEETVGIIKPKTFGGYNGDVSRKWWNTENDIFMILNRRWKDILITKRLYYGIHSRRLRH